MTTEPIEGELAETSERAVTVQSSAVPMIEAPTWSRDELATLKGTIARDTTDLEFQLFVSVARRQGLDPFARQIFAVKRGGQMTIQTSIDGFRVLAQRSGKLRGIRGPWWCGADGQWREVWLEDGHPEAAKVEVVHADYTDPVLGVARWGAFVQYRQGGGINDMWSRMGDHMLAKCAEALALRRAFPAELSGIYTDDEMGQMDDTPPSAALPPASSPPPSQQREEPRPPQARPAAAPPRAGVPPAQQAAAKAKPVWAEALRDALTAKSIGLPEVTQFLGAEATNANIQAWLDGEAGRTVAMLAEDAASLAKHEAETQAGIESGEVSPDDRPF